MISRTMLSHRRSEVSSSSPISVLATRSATIIKRKHINTIIRELEHLWIFRHGALASISADDEYNKSRFVSFFQSQGIKFKPHPTRQHSKIGFVERKNRNIKSIIQKLGKENSSDPPAEIVTRAIFLSNLFSGWRLFSSFELVRVYQPSILGIPATILSSQLLDAHKAQTATRALQRVLRSRYTKYSPLRSIQIQTTLFGSAHRLFRHTRTTSMQYYTRTGV